MESNVVNSRVYVGEWDSRNQDNVTTPTGGIIIDKRGELMFKVRVLSANSKYTHEVINVFAGEVSRLDFEDDESAAFEVRRLNFAHWAQDRVFFFNISEETNYVRVSNGREYTPNYVARNVVVLRKSNDFSSEYLFESLPIISQNEQIPNKDRFEEYLLNGKAIRMKNANYLSKNDEDVSSFAIFHEAAEINVVDDLGYLYEDLESLELGPEFIRYAVPSDKSTIEVRKIDTAQWMKAIYYNIPNYEEIIFIPQKYLKLDYLEKFTFLEKSLNKKGDSELNDELNQQQTSINVPDNILDSKSIDETSIVTHFKEMVRSPKYNLVFNDEDLANFYISIKTNLLTILSGLSGTGKSKIVTAFADSMGLISSGQFKMISVRPSWQDDADLLGFADTMHNVYRPADSGLADVLVKASTDPNHMYIVVLDEMNLARVEHYFSQFLSVLEKNPNDRIIHLYNENIGTLYNKDPYASRVKVGANVRFVGTVNIDESTFSFSDKLLDRANLIELQMVPFNKKETVMKNETSVFSLDKQQAENAQMLLINATTGTNTFSANEKMKLTNDERNFLWELDQLIMAHFPDGGFGWRTLKNIEKFLAAVSESADLSRSSAIDYQVAQRILPKLRGTQDVFDGLINMDKKELTGELIELFDNSINLSSFQLSRQLLLKKARELQVTGFVS
ncbi:McrB family protein [Lactiplantibacillus daowaiensis]|uniref:McrB family protein n=1 Tax=Lactiplantibacillus daowaiensis TaxID=2559918 RepID=A0ABW1S1N1_9LACO|nr:hypothetical protein [Lactiplantibacillus daowaiensis]